MPISRDASAARMNHPRRLAWSRALAHSENEQLSGFDVLVEPQHILWVILFLDLR